jgi:hypothetical protein
MRWVFLLLGLPLFLAVVLFVALTDAQPSLSRSAEIRMADLERGKAIIDSLGLRRMREGDVRQLALSESDLNIGVNYLAHRLVGGSADVRIALSQLVVRASVPLRGWGRFVNLQWVMGPGAEVLDLAELRVGKLALPAGLSQRLLPWLIDSSPYGEEFAAARTLLDSATLSDGSLALHFTWRRAAVEQLMQGGGIKGGDAATLSAYRDHLNKVRRGDFPVLLGEVFALAKQRSRNGDPVLENRAALNSLAERVLGSRLMSQQGIARTDRKGEVRLAGRVDFAQHFALSAFLAATGGEGLSEMAGLYKELKDAQGGSGFSFNDLAADRAGSRFGKAATRSRVQALKMQELLALAKSSESFFPQVDDLPEFMPQQEFEKRFGGVGQPAYQRMIEQIEARIAGLPIYAD